jgi:uncharacterized protein YxjI
MELTGKNHFLLAQKLTFLVNRYEYFLYDGGAQGERIGFVEQKRFAFREAMTVWKDETRAETLFSVKAEKVLDVHGRFVVRDASGAEIGYCKKVFGASLLRSTWEIYDAKNELLFVSREKHPVIAILRRVLQFIPVVGEFSAIVPFNFEFRRDEEVVGAHHRLWGSLSDRYHLEVTDTLAHVDRRLLLALGILLDALQER